MNPIAPSQTNGLFKKPTRLLKNNSDVYDISGVVTEDELKAQLEIFCAKINSPVSIFSLYNYDTKGRPLRIASPISNNSAHCCCESFRTCGGNDYCRESNYTHVDLFKGKNKQPLKLSELETGVNNNIKILLNEAKYKNYYNAFYYKNIYCNDKFNLIKYESCGNIGYVEYFCPILGYREVLLPIIVEDLVLGVLFFGQLQCDVDKDISFDIRNNFIIEHEYIFNKYFNNEEDKKILIKRLKKGIDLYKINNDKVYPIKGNEKELLEDNWITNRNPLIFIETDYNDLIKRIINEDLKTMLDELKKQLNKNRIEYIQNCLNEYVVNFNESFDKFWLADKIDDSVITEMWDKILDEAKKIVFSFNLDRIIFFGPDKSKMPEDENIKSVRSYLKSNKANKAIENYNIKVNDMPIEKLQKPSYSSNNNDLMQYIYINETKAELNDNNFFVFFPSYKNKAYSLAIFMICGETNENSIEIFKSLKKELGDAFILYYSVICTKILSLFNYITREQLHRTLSIYRHEVFNISTGLDGIEYGIDKYIKNKDSKLSELSLSLKYIQNITIDEIEDALDEIIKKEINDNTYLENKHTDFEDIIVLLRELSNNTRVVNDIWPEEKRQKFYIFNDVLHKWEHIYKMDAQQKCLYFKFFDKDKKNPMIRNPITSEKNYLNQIVYNILNNAIKYSYWGTNINIRCCKDEESVEYKLIIEDYGCFIDEKANNYYLLFYRDEKAKRYEAGSGIGLYVAQQIATKRLKTIITHKCEKLSNYNIPFIEAYLENEFIYNKKNQGLVDKLIIERQNLRNENKYEQIISDRAFELINSLNENKIIANIERPTYKVTFLLEIKNLE